MKSSKYCILSNFLEISYGTVRWGCSTVLLAEQTSTHISPPPSSKLSFFIFGIAVSRCLLFDVGCLITTGLFFFFFFFFSSFQLIDIFLKKNFFLVSLVREQRSKHCHPHHSTYTPKPGNIHRFHRSSQQIGRLVIEIFFLHKIVNKEPPPVSHPITSRLLESSFIFGHCVCVYLLHISSHRIATFERFACFVVCLLVC